MWRVWTYAALLCGIALWSTPLGAQYPKQPKLAPGSLSGEVRDASGAPFAGASIAWQASDGDGKPHILHSDAKGQFHIAPLRPGLYDLRASHSQMSSNWSHNVVVRPGENVTLTLRLRAATIPAGAEAQAGPTP